MTTSIELALHRWNPAHGLSATALNLSEPLLLQDPHRIVVSNVVDLFDASVPVVEVADIFAYMAVCFWHQFEVHTRRPERMEQLLRSDAFLDMFDDALALAIDEAVALIGDRPGMNDLRAWASDALPLPNVIIEQARQVAGEMP